MRLGKTVYKHSASASYSDIECLCPPHEVPRVQSRSMVRRKTGRPVKFLPQHHPHHLDLNKDMAKSSKALFADNEKVLCFHGPIIYEAKVQMSTAHHPRNPQSSMS